ncbi:hypothetical protein IC229_05625 [Spirosoma sp. BT702]|uniref:Uncharacterized protein n=1 Tax=Spirosoma profusum TaxID=2771354 RepID=A0A926XUA4_9BACT|nr:hypothetical protein [Spirosoma profusum]MBD2700104.1 hypothetical protein [Spirosoma profusum]
MDKRTQYYQQREGFVLHITEGVNILSINGEDVNYIRNIIDSGRQVTPHPKEYFETMLQQVLMMLGISSQSDQPALIDDLRKALIHARGVIKTWHNMDDDDERAWSIYEKNSPEMRPINEAILKGT